MCGTLSCPKRAPMPDTTNGMSDWADIDIFVGGLAIGLLIGGLFCYWAIRAFKAGVIHGLERRLREAADQHDGKCRDCGAYMTYGRVGDPGGWCDDHGPLMKRANQRPPAPPPPPADEDPGKIVKSG